MYGLLNGEIVIAILVLCICVFTLTACGGNSNLTSVDINGASSALDAKFGSMFYLPYTPDEKKYLFVGLGKKEDFDYGQLREIGSKVAQKLKTIKNIQNAKVCFCSFENQPNALKTFTQGFYIGDYSFDKYKTKKEHKISEVYVANVTNSVNTAVTVAEGWSLLEI